MPKLTEAATIKARAMRVMRDMTEMLKDKTLSDGLRRQIEDVRSSLKKTWKELGNEAIQSHGRKGVASQKPSVSIETQEMEEWLEEWKDVRSPANNS